VCQCVWVNLLHRQLPREKRFSTATDSVCGKSLGLLEERIGSCTGFSSYFKQNVEKHISAAVYLSVLVRFSVRWGCGFRFGFFSCRSVFVSVRYAIYTVCLCASCTWIFCWKKKKNKTTWFVVADCRWCCRCSRNRPPAAPSVPPPGRSCRDLNLKIVPLCACFEIHFSCKSNRITLETYIL